MIDKAQIKRERAAFLAGAKYGYESVVAWHQGKVEAETKVRYPIVTTEVATLRDPEWDFQWGIVAGQLCHRWFNADLTDSVGNWYNRADSSIDRLWMPTATRVAVWSSLFTNPTKEVSE